MQINFYNIYCEYKNFSCFPCLLGRKDSWRLVKQLHDNLQKITNDYEIVLVNDYSPDNSWLAIAAECDKDKTFENVKQRPTFIVQNTINE